MATTTHDVDIERLQCISCSKQFPIRELRYYCECGELLEVRRHDSVLQGLIKPLVGARANARETWNQSGVWRYREAVLGLTPKEIVTHPEGATRLYTRPSIADYAGIEQLFLKHEGENPTGSFKDRGMTVAVSQGRRLGLTTVACASTGNTSASLASYAAHAGMRAVVFIPQGKIATGKLAQSLAYGALCLAVRGDFDAAMTLVQDAAKKLGIYLVNSLNPFRLEGQKTIIFELLDQLERDPPDWIVVPAGNLGNTSAFGKALREAHAAGWINRLPRLAAIQASGAAPFHASYLGGFKGLSKVKAETVATAIRIGNPVNYTKATGAIAATNGCVEVVTDAEILNAKAIVDRAGIGCEPASAASLAGAKKLRDRGIIKPSDRVVLILTGHLLKDPEVILTSADAQQALIEIDPTLTAVEKALGRRSG